MKITTKMCLGLYLFAIGVIAAKRAVTEKQNLTLPAGWAVDCTCPTASSGTGYNACCRNGGDLAATSPEMCDKTVLQVLWTPVVKDFNIFHPTFLNRWRSFVHQWKKKKRHKAKATSNKQKKNNPKINQAPHFLLTSQQWVSPQAESRTVCRRQVTSPATADKA